MPFWLVFLLLTALVLYTDDYIIAGILPEVAQSLGVSLSAAGQLVTVFSFTVAVAAPVSAVLFARVSRRVLFVLGLVIFASANLVAASAQEYSLLFFARIAAAVAVASVTPSVFAYAAGSAPEGKTGRYVAVVALGVTGALAIGTPLGSLIGGSIGWRTTFVVMAAAALLLIPGLLVFLPRVSNEEAPLGLLEQVRVLSRPSVSLGLVANAVLMTGSMMMMTYLVPFLSVITDLGLAQRAGAFSLAGFAGMIGIWVGGLAADRWGSDRTLAVGVGGIVVSLLTLLAFWFARPVPLVPVLVVLTFWGGLAFFISPPIQARLHNLAGAASPQALALNTSGGYLGVSAGGLLGGVLLESVGVEALPAVGAACGGLAYVLIAAAVRVGAGTRGLAPKEVGD